MAEIVESALVGEMVSRISTVLIDKPGKRSSERDDVERLEMAHIKMEAALHISRRWQIVNVPMLRWRSKLKHAAQECGDTLRRYKQRAEEDEDMRRSSSLPGRIARGAMSFMAYFSTGNDSGSSDTVHRFERFAEQTSEFLKMVEFGGRRYTFFNPLIGDLLLGKTLHYQALQGDKFYCLIVRPASFAERGVEAMVGFVSHDMEEPAKSFSLGLILRLSESTDIFGIIIKCMKSMASVPHFMIAAKDVRRELIQLPSQDFSWVVHSPHGEECSINVHHILSQCFRPDPLCCSDHDRSTNPSNTNSATPMYPEEVIVVYLQCCISLDDEIHTTVRTSSSKHARKRRRSANSVSALVKLGILSTPHLSFEGIASTAEGYVYEVINGNEQRIVHKNTCLQHIDKTLLPKAVEHLYQNSESMMYQICLRSTHASAYLCMEKTICQVPSRRTQSQSRIHNKRLEPCSKDRLSMKLIEAVRALATARGKEQMDIAAFGFSASAGNWITI